jgi:hypothetical protein
MDGTIRDRMEREQAARFFGREQELAELASRLVDDSGPAVTFVHGVGGIGKTTLLDALERRAQAAGLTVMRFDCGAIEPTPRGLLHGLGERLGQDLATIDVAAQVLADLDGRVALVFDDYQSFRLLDSWLRRTFIPALPDHVRVLLSSRAAPADGWVLTPGWRGLVDILQIGPLDDDAVDALLQSEHVPVDAVPRIRAFAGGHPLALRLAAGATGNRSRSAAPSMEPNQIVATLATRFLEDVGDPDTRRALEAAAVLRRATRSVLAEMLGTVEIDPILSRLRGLPFVTLAPDGLMIHEMVRLALAQWLRAVDPKRYQDLRRVAWNHLRREVESVGRVQLWRYTADILYLVEQPSVREAFFPADIPQQLVEPARPDDGEGIVAITRRHDGSEGARAVSAWWEELPDAFSVVRGAHGDVLAYSILTFAPRVSERITKEDPVVDSWLAHAAAAGLPDDRPVLFSRRLLTRDGGERSSIERAACFIDVKRIYLENPRAARIYTAMHLDEELLAVFRPLGFRVLEDLSVEQDGRRLETLMLDFGPEGIPGWIARLVDALYGAPAPRFGLDAGARALVLDGLSVPLTRLEFGVMDYLAKNEGRVVTRDEMLREIWHQPFGGSNVVDAVIRTLRKKLRSDGRAIETVKGHGYRFRGFGNVVDSASP